MVSLANEILILNPLLGTKTLEKNDVIIYTLKIILNIFYLIKYYILKKSSYKITIKDKII